MKILKKLFPLIVLLLLSFWAIKPFFHSGFFPMHDDTQVARVFEMHKSLSDWMVPVRWVKDLGYGYGYPVFNFYAPFAYYIGAKFMFLGFDALSATKIMMAFGVLLSGVSMYFLAREFWGEAGGVVSALLYLYAPYHAVDIYVRGDVAEFWAYCFIPLVFFAVYKVFTSLQKYIDLTSKSKIKDQKSKMQIENKKEIWYFVCLVAISYAGIILSHNLSAMMVSPVIFLFALILYVIHRSGSKVHKPYFILLGLLLGIILSSFYWLPVFPELKYTNVLSVVGGGSNYKDHFVCLTQLWNSPWGYGGSVPGCVDGLSFKIGKLHLLLSLFSLPVLFLLYKKNKTKFILILFFVISAIFSIFLTLKESIFIWNSIPHMAFFQFPWRFLLLVSFFTSILGGSIFYFIPKQKYITFLGGVLLSFIVIFVNSKVFLPQKILNKTSADYTSKFSLNWTTSKISYEYMPKNFSVPLFPAFVPTSKIVSKKDIKTKIRTDKTNLLSFKTDTKKTSNINLNIAYFPGWHVFIDGKQVWFKYSNRGLIVNVPSGRHSIDIKFIQTPIEKAGNVLSLAGVIILLAGIIIHNRKIYNG